MNPKTKHMVKKPIKIPITNVILNIKSVETYIYIDTDIYSMYVCM